MKREDLMVMIERLNPMNCQEIIGSEEIKKQFELVNRYEKKGRIELADLQEEKLKEMIWSFREEDEIWKPVPGYEGIYEVSDRGRVKAVQRIRSYDGAVLKEKILKGGMFSNGYRFITARKDGRQKNELVHRFVALAFVLNDDPENKKIVNHKNGDKLNCTPKNLEWETSSYNQFHASYTGIRKTRVKSEDADRMKKLYSTGLSQKKIAEMFSVSQVTVSLILKDKIKRLSNNSTYSAD